MGDYHELEVFMKGRKLAVFVYRKTAKFPADERFTLVDQMRRAAVSIASNIAEAQGRDTSRERLRFLHIARGSLCELEMQALISGDLHFLTSRQTDILIRSINQLGRQLNTLIAHYRKRRSVSPDNRQPTTDNPNSS